jgi:hypothetical protein
MANAKLPLLPNDPLLFECTIFDGTAVYDDCNAHTDNYTELGGAYTNHTGMDRKIGFTGSKEFKAKEIEVFESTDETTLPNNRLAAFARFCSYQSKNTEIVIISAK